MLNNIESLLSALSGFGLCGLIFIIKTKIQTRTIEEWEDKKQIITKQDIQVIEESIQFFDNENNWDKLDDRLCLPTEQKSLFCSLAFSSQEIIGRYDHRGAPSQEVRNTIEDEYSSRWSKHPLLDFNNHPDTTIRDIQKVLCTTLKRCRVKVERLHD